jgi:hypothetical protein
MNLQEIASFINQNTRFKLVPDQIVLIIDSVQKLAFDNDMVPFKYWDATQQIYIEIEFASAGYTDAVVTDIGLPVVGAVSGTTGTLISYDNTTRKWVVDAGDDDDYTAGEAITITGGTGAGDLLAVDHQANYKGPYAFPTAVPVRKMIGMTTYQDTRIFGVEVVYAHEVYDYGLWLNQFNERTFYKSARIDPFAKTLTLIDEPGRVDTYRWVYFRNPETITDLDNDDDKLLIPDAFHMNLIQACISQANVSTEDGESTRATIIKHFGDWWEQVRRAYTPMLKAANQTNEGCLNTDSFM